LPCTFQPWPVFVSLWIALFFYHCAFAHTVLVPS
jgi:hypothetical protein